MRYNAARRTNSQVAGLSRPWIFGLRSRSIVSHLRHSFRCDAAYIADAVVENCHGPLGPNRFFGADGCNNPEKYNKDLGRNRMRFRILKNMREPWVRTGLAFPTANRRFLARPKFPNRPCDCEHAHRTTSRAQRRFRLISGHPAARPRFHQNGYAHRRR